MQVDARQIVPILAVAACGRGEAVAADYEFGAAHAATHRTRGVFGSHQNSNKNDTILKVFAELW